MKTVILAGGMGTRLMEETQLRPKPMVEVGGKPILWHIMKYYSHFGFNDFIICLGYRGEMIVDYFINYKKYNADIKINTKSNEVTFLSDTSEEFNVTLVNTGLNTNTAGRIHKIKNYIGEERFMMTYGDGLSNVEINKLIKFHDANDSLVTLTSIKPTNPFGIISSDSNGLVDSFEEKIDLDLKINAGFFVMEPGIFDYLGPESEKTQWEKGPLKEIAKDSKLSTFEHEGFWKCMDALRDKVELEKLWNSNPPWKVW